MKTFLQTQHQTDGTHKNTHGPHKWLDEQDYANFTAAVAAAANKTLVVARSINLDANTVIPASVSLKFINPGVINANGFTLTINGPIVGNPMHQIFNGFAAGEITGLKEINPAWVGAVADWNGSTGTDNTSAFQLAMSISTKLKVSKGSYYLATSLSPVRFLQITGAGIVDGATFICNSHFMTFTSAITSEEIRIKDIAILGTGSYATTKYALNMVSGTIVRLQLDNVYVWHMKRVIYASASTNIVGLHVDNCLFENQYGWNIEFEIDVGSGGSNSVMHFNNTYFADNGVAGAIAGVTDGHMRIVRAVTFMKFTNCAFESASGTHAVYIGASSLVHFSNCYFGNNCRPVSGVPVAGGRDIYNAGGVGTMKLTECSFSTPYESATAFYNIEKFVDTGQVLIVEDCSVNTDAHGAEYLGFIGGAGPDRPNRTFVKRCNFTGKTGGGPFDWLANAGTDVVRENNLFDSSVANVYKRDIIRTLTTTGDTVTNMFNTENYLGVYVPGTGASSTFLIEAKVICRNLSGTVYGAYVSRNLFSVDASYNVTDLGELSETPIESNAALNVSFAAGASGTSSARLVMQVRGLVGETIYWVAEISEMAVKAF